ncbi:hypothetical protein OAD35_01300 [Pseudomonadales bacterium]|nr:hypothetical protein [Pseudomonadales bacterium]MDA9298243.1 hypothetical protein [Pseudomonadales bacterium]MDB9942140.1 hypothetical protein [Pseudomonadales bacterium]
MFKILYPALLTLLIFTANAEEAVVRSQAVVFSAPKGGADKVVSLEAETRVETGVRRGLWVELIKPSQGWVKLRSLKMGTTGTGSTSSSLSGLKSGREGVGNAVSASGVRGLDAEMIKLSDPDFQALEEFKKSAVVSLDAMYFATDRSLSGRKIAYLSDPIRAQNSSKSLDASKTAAAKTVKKPNSSKNKQVVSDDDW